MNSLRKIILILFLLTYVGRRVTAINECLKNIHNDFGYGEERPHNSRDVWPMKAFLKLNIGDMVTEHGQGYFENMRDMMILKANMLLPNQFCEINAKEQEFKICSDALAEKFLISDTKLDVVKDTYSRYKETSFISFNPDGSMSYLNKNYLIKISKNGLAKVSTLMYKNRDGSRNYRYMYFFHLSQNFQFPQSERNFPYTPKQYCLVDKRIKENERRNQLAESSYEFGEGSMSAYISLDYVQQ